MTSTVKVTAREGWATVRIVREARRNALDRATRQALAEALGSLKGAARAIVVTGTGESFCAGLDVREREADRLAGRRDTAGEEWIDLAMALREHPAVIVAAVNGLALGGGVTLVNVADLAIAADTAQIGFPEIGFATYASVGGPTAQLTMPRKRAAWMLLTAERIDAVTAERWGLVNEVVPPDRLLPRAEEVAARIAGFDAVAIAEIKAALDEVPARISDWRAAMEYGQTVNRRIRAGTHAGGWSRAVPAREAFADRMNAGPARRQ